MKRFYDVIIVAFMLVACLLLGCQGKPADMDQTTYDLAQEAISVGHGCVSGETSPSDAARRLGDIYDKLDAYAPINSVSHTIVAGDVLCMEMEASGVGGDMDKLEMQKLVEQLEEACR